MSEEAVGCVYCVISIHSSDAGQVSSEVSIKRDGPRRRVELIYATFVLLASSLRRLLTNRVVSCENLYERSTGCVYVTVM